MEATFRLRLFVAAAFCAFFALFAIIVPRSGAQQKPPPDRPPTSFMPVIEEPFETVRARDKANKGRIAAAHQRLLQARYDLSRRVDQNVKMTRGKPIPVGPTARLKRGMTFEQLAQMSPDEVRAQDLFPYLPLPHVD